MYNPNSPNNVPPPLSTKIYTVEEFDAIATEWIEYIDKRTVEVEVDKVVQKDGKALKMTKPDIPQIWKFCQYAKLELRTYNNYSGGTGYEPYFPIARRIKEYCNARVLDLMMQGVITDKSGAFYLINNSTMVDKQEVVQRVVDGAKPKWLTNAPTLPNADQKALPHETIPYEDVPPENE